MQQPLAPLSHPGAAATLKKKRLQSPMSLLIGVLLIGLAIIVSLMLVLMVNNKGFESAINKEKYQAVFLNSQDGQVYFGKLEGYSTDFYKLSDIYYVRVEQKLQPDSTNGQTTNNISLAKLGNELHGPEDVMYISRDKVLFWENLKEDGQVVKAIREYQKNPQAATQQQTTPTTTNTTTTNQTNTTTNTTKP